MFCASYVKPVANIRTIRESENSEDLPKAISIGVDNLLAGIIPEPLTHPLLIKAHGAPCLGYAFAAIYHSWPITIASNSLEAAWRQANSKPSLVHGSRGTSVHPVVIARASPMLDIDYKIVDDGDDIELLRPFVGMLKAELGADRAKDIEEALMASVKRYR